MAKNLSFEDKMKRLDEIVSNLESDNTNIDSAIILYEEGLKLCKELKLQLTNFEEKIEELSKEK